MADLKPIGSEKLTGMDKINRILEISRYNENKPSNVNETSRNEYGITLTDGNSYQIVKERLGYIIKKTISESETDYIEPMKNRKYYPSYSQALKRLNLVTKEVNRLTENEEGTSLFGEQKKFVLKTQKNQEPQEPEADTPPPPAEPPAVPTPELPPSPEGEEPMGDVEGMAPEGEEPVDDMAPEGDDMGDEGASKDEEISFKSIQKLTGKLTQKMREFDSEKGLTSENIKYVINMVLSAADLNSLSEEDKEDIISKFDEEEGMGDEGMDDMGDEEMGDEGMGDEGMNDTGMEPEGEETVSPEAVESYGSILDSIFSESKVDDVISKYFDVSSKEVKTNRINESIRREHNNKIIGGKMKKVIPLCETIEQEWASKKFLSKNPNFVLVGKTNLKNLVFENSNKQFKITPKGNIL
jgi:hypothetical protein